MLHQANITYSLALLLCWLGREVKVYGSTSASKAATHLSLACCGFIHTFWCWCWCCGLTWAWGTYLHQTDTIRYSIFRWDWNASLRRTGQSSDPGIDTDRRECGMSKIKKGSSSLDGCCAGRWWCVGTLTAVIRSYCWYFLPFAHSREIKFRFAWSAFLLLRLSPAERRKFCANNITRF